MNEPFTSEQTRYLEGLTTGIQIARQYAPAPASTSVAAPAEDALSLAHAATLRRGGKLTAEEILKREKHPLDRLDEISQRADNGVFPKAGDIFVTKNFGLFYTAPAQEGFMCRLRFPGGFLSAAQLRGLADITNALAGGYVHVTTRANLQLREIQAQNALRLLEALDALNIPTRGAGADNVRNITASPLSGIDPEELIDVRAHCRAMDFRIRNTRDFYSLPRKFNIAFDGGGALSCVSETNDLAFVAERGIDDAVRYRIFLGGITGHGDLAADTGYLIAPDQAVNFAGSVLRVFLREGDRTDRKKARLKYVIERLGMPALLKLITDDLGASLRATYAPNTFTQALRSRADAKSTHRLAHIGIHEQAQTGKFYAGFALRAGLLRSTDMHKLADLSEEYGSGDIALTVWQNLILRDLDSTRRSSFESELQRQGLFVNASTIAAGMVACTGARGCRFANSDTKLHANLLIDELADVGAELGPINIHITGCPNSCAQHRIGDIGLLGTRIITDDNESEGYHIYLGGGYGSFARIGEAFLENVSIAELPSTIRKLINAARSMRTSNETFAETLARIGSAALKQCLAHS